MSSSTLESLNFIIFVLIFKLRDLIQASARLRPRLWRTEMITERPLSDALEYVTIKLLEICWSFLFKPDLLILILNLGLMIMITSY